VNPASTSSMENLSLAPEGRRRRSNSFGDRNMLDDMENQYDMNESTGSANREISANSSEFNNSTRFSPLSRSHNNDYVPEITSGTSSTLRMGDLRAANQQLSQPSRSATTTETLRLHRASMSDIKEADKRTIIKDIIRDTRLSQLEKRRTIQHLMDGRHRITDDSGQTNSYSNAAIKKRPSESEADGMGGVPTAEQREALRKGANMGAGGPTKQRRSTFEDSEAAVDSSSVCDAITNGTSSSIMSGSEAGSSTRICIASAEVHEDMRGKVKSPSEENLWSVENIYEDGGLPCHNPIAEAAIAEIRAQVQREELAEKHPYAAIFTPVPAIAAHASEVYPNTANRDVCRRAIETASPCTHYKRKLHIVAPCCGATFGCRICHDDCPVLPPPLEFQMGVVPGAVQGTVAHGNPLCDSRYRRLLRTSSMPSNPSLSMNPPEHHQIDRFAIKEIICQVCFTKQSSKSNSCINCGIQFGEYHCAICNLWMSNEERPYHCPDCGFCRVGGGENFIHCHDCGMCIDKDLFDTHNCKVGKYMSNCPVCQEDLFSSRDASHELPCGHAIHWHCFQQLASHDSRCPICKKTVESHERMKPMWDAMAMSITMQPVPPEMCKVVTVKCNDCESSQKNRSWHFLGVQCVHCDSFNTVIERINMMGQEAHEFLLRRPPRGVAQDLSSSSSSEAPISGPATRVSPVRSGPAPSFSTGVISSNASLDRHRQRRRRATVAVEGHSAPPLPPFGNFRGNS